MENDEILKKARIETEKKELIKEIKRKGLKPADIFDKFDLLADEDIKKMVEEEADLKIHLDNLDLNKQMDEEIEREEKLKEEENDLIPGDTPAKKKEPEKKKKPDNDDDMIPDLEPQGEPGEDEDLIPD